jgi:RNA polymerase sigma factor (sigma-70 family)
MNSPAEAELTDHELLQAHVDGDADAFAILFRRHRDRLWAVALRTMGNPDDAADGLQDGMIAAYRRAGSFRGDAAVTTWLHRVVVNACLDRIRAAKVRRADPLPEDLDDIGDRGSLLTSTREAADRPTSPWSRSAAGPCSRPSSSYRPTNGRRWCWSTWRGTPSTRPPPSSTAPPAR